MESCLHDALKSIHEYTPAPWNLIPDLGLYMDQVITFITRMYQPLYGESTEGCLSASMINNYVKAKVIPRPVGKKYSREQIALLAMIVPLKQVASIEEVRKMITPCENMSVEQLYTLFCQRQKAALASLCTDDANQPCTLPPAMDFAIAASSYRVGCSAMLNASAHQTEE